MSFWNHRKVLITGGASLIGSHLVDRLVRLAATVRVADNLSSGSLDNLLSTSGDIEFLHADLRNQGVADDACRGMDTVFHLAACHGGRGFIHTHPVECSANFILDGIVFEAAHRANVENICFASSACVYPTTLQEDRASAPISLREDMANLHEPGKAFADGEYGWAKLMGEMVLQAYSRQYGVKTAACRIFTAYGERENETHAVIAWIARALIQQNPFPIWGSGQQDRNFTYVGDIADGLILAAEHIVDGSAVNLGSPRHIKVVDAVRLVLETIGFDPEIVFDESKPTGVFSRAADTSRAHRLLGWEPRTGFEEGVKRTIDWYLTTHDQEYVRENLDMLLMERIPGGRVAGPRK